MAEWSIKGALKKVPQPYKTWIARIILPFFLVATILIAAVRESAVWCKEMARESADAWREVRSW